MEIRLLGPLNVIGDDGALGVRGARERALLAALGVRAGRVVHADRLIEAVWAGDRLPAHVDNSLQVAVSRLRRQLSAGGHDVVRRATGGYRLAVDRDCVDALRFERLVADAANAEDAITGARLLAESLELWRGEALADVEAHGWLHDEGVRLEELRVDAIEQHMSAQLASGGGGELVADLERLVAHHPLRERLRSALMTALYRSGRQAEALTVFDQTRRMLAEELGIDPSTELRELHRAILTHDPALGGQAPRHAVRLPARLTSFVGRERELVEVERLLCAHRMITVIGPGGVGKTSLAVAAARLHAERSPTDAWFVDLAPVRDGERAAGAALAALGVRSDGVGATEIDPVDRLVGSLRTRKALLLLDNCEHLVDATARMADRLLRECPGVSLLVTSRDVLGVPGEVVWGAPPLRLPSEAGDDQADAVVLFVDRARTADPGFELHGNDTSVVAGICARLDGLPLAIELAAARVRAMSLGDIAARLDDRFRLLQGGARIAPPRHQTLRAALDWSFGLLTPREAAMFTRLAVFVSPWTLSDAETVCADDTIPSAEVMPLVLRLVDRSLVARSGEKRLRLLETMRSYAEELGDDAMHEGLRRRHAEHFLALSEELGRSPSSRALLDLVEAAMDDVDAALDWSQAHDDLLALRFVGALGWMWATFHIAEGRRRLAQVMGRERAHPSAALGRALQAVAYVESYMPTPETKQQALQSVALLDRFGDAQGAARSRVITAFIEMMLSGDLAWAARITDEAAAGAAAIDDTWTGALAELMRFRLHLHRGDIAAGLDHGREALSRFSSLDDPWGVPWTSIWLAVALRTAGQVEEAQDLLEPVAASLPPTSYAASIGLQELGTAAALRGRTDDAVTAHARAIDLAARSGVPVLVAFAHAAAGFGARVRGAPIEARGHYSTALTLFREVAVDVGVAQSMCGLGLVELDLGEREAARQHLVEALNIAHHTGRADTAAAAAEGLALLWAGDEPRRAALLLGSAGAVRSANGIRYAALETDERARAERECRRHLPDPDFGAAVTEGSRIRGVDLLTLIDSGPR